MLSILRPKTRTPRSPRIPKPIPAAPGDEAAVCRMIFDELCVLANGDVVCSCGDPAGLRVYGNVHRDRIDTLYNGPMYREMRRWQLESKPDAWCPVTGQACGGRVSRARSDDREDGRRVRILQIEPVGACNLSCPECPATSFDTDKSFRSDRTSTLPLAVMLDVVDQLPDLEKILFYNFGEPFLHKDAVEFLRRVRRDRPEVAIHTSTNGLAFTPAKIEALAEEALLDRVVFSLDGATQESYARYRVGGDLERAVGNLELLMEALERHGTADRVEVLWQYILFEWNDSDDEIAAVRRRAEEIGVPLQWIVTHTAGASQRFVEGSPALAELRSGRDLYGMWTCDLRAEDLWKNDGAARGLYRCRWEAPAAPTGPVTGRPGERVVTPARLTQGAAVGWGLDDPDAFRLGYELRDERGRPLGELHGTRLPVAARRPGASGDVLLDFRLPDTPGRYRLLVDVVEEGRCWFSERGAAPLLLDLEVTEGREDRDRGLDTVAGDALARLLGERPDDASVAYWAARLWEADAESWLHGVLDAAGRGAPDASHRRAFLDAWGATPPLRGLAASR